MIPNVPDPARGGAAGSGRHQKRLASDFPGYHPPPITRKTKIAPSATFALSRRRPRRAPGASTFGSPPATAARRMAVAGRSWAPGSGPDDSIPFGAP